MEPIIVLTQDQLQELIETTVRKVFAEQDFNQKEKEDKLYNLEEAAQFLGVAKQTLYGYISKQTIAYMKPTKRLIFKRSDLLAYMHKGRHSTMEEYTKNYFNNRRKSR